MISDHLVPDWPAPASVQALSTTRRGGVSSDPYRSLNLGAHTEDSAAAVAENRRLLGESLPAAPTWLTQVHGDAVIELPAAVGTDADGAIARTSGQVCVVMTADCLPLLLCDRSGSVVAAVHCGWRGLMVDIIARAVDAMASDDLIAWLGPAIGPGAYQVGADLAERFLATDRAPADAFIEDGPGKVRCDLYRIARAQLGACGVTGVWGGDRCTHAEAGTFYSHRRDGDTGRQASLIWLAESEPHSHRPVSPMMRTP